MKKQWVLIFLFYVLPCVSEASWMNFYRDWTDEDRKALPSSHPVVRLEVERFLERQDGKDFQVRVYHLSSSVSPGDNPESEQGEKLQGRVNKGVMLFEDKAVKLTLEQDENLLELGPVDLDFPFDLVTNMRVKFSAPLKSELPIRIFSEREVLNRELLQVSSLIVKDGRSLLKEIIKKHLDENPGLLDSSQDQDIVVFLGNTGAGKSTSINYLAEKRLMITEDGDILLDPSEKGMKIGVGSRSETRLPQHVKVGNLVFYDLPGFKDTRGLLANLINASFIRHIIQKARSVRFVFVAGSDEVIASRGESLKSLVQMTQTLFPDLSIKSSLMITRVDHRYQNLEAHVRFLEKKVQPNLLSQWIKEGRLLRIFFPDLARNEMFHLEEKQNTLETIEATPHFRVEKINTAVMLGSQDLGLLESFFADEIQEVFNTFLKRLLNLEGPVPDDFSSLDFDVLEKANERSKRIRNLGKKLKKQAKNSDFVSLVSRISPDSRKLYKKAWKAKEDELLIEFQKFNEKLGKALILKRVLPKVQSFSEKMRRLSEINDLLSQPSHVSMEERKNWVWSVLNSFCEKEYVDIQKWFNSLLAGSKEDFESTYPISGLAGLTSHSVPSSLTFSRKKGEIADTWLGPLGQFFHSGVLKEMLTSFRFFSLWFVKNILSLKKGESAIQVFLKGSDTRTLADYMDSSKYHKMAVSYHPSGGVTYRHYDLSDYAIIRSYPLLCCMDESVSTDDVIPASLQPSAFSNLDLNTLLFKNESSLPDAKGEKQEVVQSSTVEDAVKQTCLSRRWLLKSLYFDPRADLSNPILFKIARADLNDLESYEKLKKVLIQQAGLTEKKPPVHTRFITEVQKLMKNSPSEILKASRRLSLLGKQLKRQTGQLYHLRKLQNSLAGQVGVTQSSTELVQEFERLRAELGKKVEEVFCLGHPQQARVVSMATQSERDSLKSIFKQERSSLSLEFLEKAIYSNIDYYQLIGEFPGSRLRAQLEKIGIERKDEKWVRAHHEGPGFVDLESNLVRSYDELIRLDEEYDFLDSSLKGVHKQNTTQTLSTNFQGLLLFHIRYFLPFTEKQAEELRELRIKVGMKGYELFRVASPQLRHQLGLHAFGGPDSSFLEQEINRVSQSIREIVRGLLASVLQQMELKNTLVFKLLETQFAAEFENLLSNSQYQSFSQKEQAILRSNLEKVADYFLGVIRNLFYLDTPSEKQNKYEELQEHFFKRFLDPQNGEDLFQFPLAFFERFANKLGDEEFEKNVKLQDVDLSSPLGQLQTDFIRKFRLIFIGAFYFDKINLTSSLVLKDENIYKSQDIKDLDDHSDDLAFFSHRDLSFYRDYLVAVLMCCWQRDCQQLGCDYFNALKTSKEQAKDLMVEVKKRFNVESLLSLIDYGKPETKE